MKEMGKDTFYLLTLLLLAIATQGCSAKIRSLSRDTTIDPPPATHTPGYWTRMNASTGADPAGDWGTQGIAAGTNIPPSQGSQGAWDPVHGVYWLFGTVDGVNSPRNDLWKWDGTNWTWMTGDAGHAFWVQGNYGTQGTTDPLNVPGSRRNGAMWVDSAGNPWLFGGYCVDEFNQAGDCNDLWKFDVSSGEWTWVRGSQDVTTANPNWGTINVAASTNEPWASTRPIHWVDGSGLFWMFSGYQDGNSLWSFDPSSEQWTWRNGPGSASGGYVSDHYGTKGVASALNIPGGGRSYGVGWTDVTGTLWMLYGYGMTNGSTTTQSQLDDVWMYDPTSGNWTWEAGNALGLLESEYGTQDVAASANIPPNRSDQSGVGDGAFGGYLFGGNDGTDFFNDLWYWDGTQWTWLSGDQGAINSAGSAGTQGVGDLTNSPRALSNANMWRDSSGEIWLFGGSDGTSVYNTLWKWSP
jgi:hypothetical protein